MYHHNMYRSDLNSAVRLTRTVVHLPVDLLRKVWPGLTTLHAWASLPMIDEFSPPGMLSSATTHTQQ